MEITLLEGFDQMPGAADVRATLEALGYAVPGSGEITWADGRTAGSQSVSLAQTDTNVAVQRTVPFGDTWSTGFALFASERAQILSLNSGDLVVGWDDEGLHLRDQVSTAKPIRDRWYYIELETDKTALECRVYINGTLDMTAPLPDALDTASEVTVQLGGVNPTNEAGQEPPVPTDFVPTDMRFDDWYIGDTAVGPIEVKTRFPTADAVSEWDTPTGSGPHWSEVARQPPEDDHFVTSYETGAVDTFTSDDPLDGSAEVIAVAVTARARKGDIDERALGLKLGDDELVQDTLTLEDEWYTKVFVAPESSPWAGADIASKPFGVVVR